MFVIETWDWCFFTLFLDNVAILGQCVLYVFVIETLDLVHGVFIHCRFWMCKFLFSLFCCFFFVFFSLFCFGQCVFYLCVIETLDLVQGGFMHCWLQMQVSSVWRVRAGFWAGFNVGTRMRVNIRDRSRVMIKIGFRVRFHIRVLQLYL